MVHMPPNHLGASMPRGRVTIVPLVTVGILSDEILAAEALDITCI
jgi:hypothetical protein